MITFFLIAGLVAADAEEHPVRPYVDPTQLAVDWPKHSHYKQPWRAFMETKSGSDFLRGLGVNYTVTANDEVAIRLLAQAGFRAVRLEVPWTNMRWDESGLENEKQLRQTLSLFRRYQLRPTILLNANHGAPGPMRVFEKQLMVDAPKGSRTVILNDTNGITRSTGISHLTAYWAAEALITNIVPFTRECTLSKPLTRDLKAGSMLSLAQLKYLPLYPVGTTEFDQTAAGWVRYATMVCGLVRDAGIDSFDVEIWNELSFGSNFLEINRYYQPPLVAGAPDFLREGGAAWELARRTVTAVKREHPEARCIWGFSNTTFFHTAIEGMPAGMDGQSYHPYGADTRRLPEREYNKGRPELNVEGYTPTVEIRMPEGWAHTFLQTESLMRLLEPRSRERRPPGVSRFLHFMTEHGVGPSSTGVRDEKGAWELKAKCALRSFSLWLNKGIDTLHYFSAYDKDRLGMGLLPVNLPTLPANASFDEVATLPMRAVRNLTKAFAGSAPLPATTNLSVDVVALGPQGKNFEGDATHPPLWQRNCFAFLPFQVDSKTFVIVTYVMSWDVTRPFDEARYRLAIGGFNAPAREVTLYDPLRDETIPVRRLDRGGNQLEVEIPTTDTPRLLTIRL
jgi:hypothetical protein